MKRLTKRQVEKILKEKGFDPKISWFYTQFKNKFEEEYNIFDIKFEEAYNNLISFLNKNKIKEILFFPDPAGGIIDPDEIPNAIVKTEELKDFLKKYVDIATNCHVADKELKWIFTITHDEDFFISGTKNLTKVFIKFFKGVEVMSREEITAKWANKES